MKNHQKYLALIFCGIIALVVKELTSDNDGMDKRVYVALKSEAFQDIRYQYTSAILSPAAEGHLLISIGQLTIAGTTQEIRT